VLQKNISAILVVIIRRNFKNKIKTTKPIIIQVKQKAIAVTEDT